MISGCKPNKNLKTQYDIAEKKYHSGIAKKL
jgi:hypothetical protein